MKPAIMWPSTVPRSWSSAMTAHASRSASTSTLIRSAVSASKSSCSAHLMQQCRWSMPKVLLVLAYLSMATLHAAVESTHDYETEYLVLGRLAWSGVSLYADEFTGQWAPLPFYLYGVTQLWGPSLALGRALSVLLGLGVVLLTFRLGGALAAGLVITHGLVVGSYSTVHFSPLTSLLLLAVVERQCHHQQPRKQQEDEDVAQRQPVSHLASKEQVAEQQAGQEDQQ